MADLENIAYVSDISGIVKIPAGDSVVSGNIPKFGAGGTIVDSGKSASGIVEAEEVASLVESEVSENLSDVLSEIRNIDAIGAYVSNQWRESTQYNSGDYCRYQSSGYKCIESHTSGVSFDTGAWKVVLTEEGIQSLDMMLSEYSTDGLVSLSNIAPPYSPSGIYSEGDLVSKDGLLQVCTRGGVGQSQAAFSSSYSLNNALRSYFASKQDMRSKADATALDHEYDTSSSGYYEGDTCVKDGKWYKCTDTVPQGSIWDQSCWIEITVKDAVSEGVTQVNADWDETDDESPSYIFNKPEIPRIDDTLSKENEAADAFAVGRVLSSVRQEIEGLVSVKDIPYVIEEISALDIGDEGYSESKVTYRLKDRYVNFIDVEIYDNREIVLVPPEAQTGDGGSILSRDFYVVFRLDSNQDANVEMSGQMKLEDFAGEDVSIVVPVGKFVTYRFTDTDESQSVFLVTLFADPAYKKIREIEMALDKILEGYVGEWYGNGMYLKDDSTGMYHKITAVTDPSTGEVNIGVNQEGVYGPEGRPEHGTESSGSSGEG